MDYAFAPGSSSYDRNVKTFFRRRPNTVLVDKHKIVRVDQFINYLETDTTIVKPIGNIIITSHGNDGGQWFITFANINIDNRPGPDPVTTYEVLEVADTSGVNNLSPSITDSQTKLHIKGCKIGQDHATPFVEKLKSCFGSTVPVTAPRHFHAIHPVPRVGILEYLGYDFSLVRSSYIKGKNARAELISAFQAKHFTFLDGTTKVPDESWDLWLPKDISKGKRNASFRVNFSPVLKNNKGKDLNSLRVVIGKAFRAETERFTYRILFSGGSAPTSLSDQQSKLRSNLQTNPKFASTHPYPMWKRYELDSFNDFIDGFTWKFTVSKNKKTLTCVGSRIKYTIVVPITKNPLTTNELLLNISPEPGNTSPVTPQIVETNSKMFLTV